MTSNGVSDELAGTQPTPCVAIRSSFAAATDRPLVMPHKSEVAIVTISVRAGSIIASPPTAPERRRCW